MKSKISIFIPIIIALLLLTTLISMASAAARPPIPNSVTAVSAFKSDDFNQQTLAPFWTHVEGVSGDPAPVMNGSEVAITVPAGIDHNIWITDGNQASRIMQPALDTNFEVEVKFTSGVSETYQMQGVLVEQDSDDFLRFEFYGRGGQTYGYAAEFENGDVIWKDTVANIELGNTAPLYMKVNRQGDDWTYTYSKNGTNWLPLITRTLTRTLTVNSIGIYAGTTANFNPPGHTTVADYFYNTANPGPFTLTTDKVGNGSVTPDQGNYSASEFVTVEAIPDTGWTFDSWSGDLSGTTNPTQIMMDDNKTVTATFTPIDYSLNVSVNPAGAGTVAKNPDMLNYVYGDVVTLTATAEPGWTFSDWSGDLISTTNPALVTIDGDKNITANFTKGEYSLNVGVVGGGQVAKDPDKLSYTFGDVVTLTATADTGWNFQDWSGDVVSTTNPIQVTIDANKNITATFSGLYDYTLYLPYISTS